MALYDVRCVVVTRSHSHMVSEDYATVRDLINEFRDGRASGLVELRSADGASISIDPREVLMIREERD